MIGNLFGVKHPIPGLRSRVVYKFDMRAVMPVAETTRHFSTRKSVPWCALCSVDCFHILDHDSTSFQPFLNQQLHHVNLKLSLLIPTLSRFMYMTL